MITRLIIGTLAAVTSTMAQVSPALPEREPALAAGSVPESTTQQARTTVVAEAGSPVPWLPESLSMGVAQPTFGRPARLLDPAQSSELMIQRERYGGVAGEMLGREHPWQLFSPLAPASLGDGTRHLTQDLMTGRGEGLVLFSIRLGRGGSSKSVAERWSQVETPSKPSVRMIPTPPQAPTPSGTNANEL